METETKQGKEIQTQKVKKIKMFSSLFSRETETARHPARQRDTDRHAGKAD